MCCVNVHTASITYGHSQDSYQQSCHQDACKNGFCHLQKSPPATTGHKTKRDFCTATPCKTLHSFKLMSVPKYSFIHLPLLVARASKTLRNTNSAKGVKMRPIVKTCEAGKDRVCHPFSIRTWASFRSAMRAWKNLPTAIIARLVSLAKYSMHSHAIICAWISAKCKAGVGDLNSICNPLHLHLVCLRVRICASSPRSVRGELSKHSRGPTLSLLTNSAEACICGQIDVLRDSRIMSPSAKPTLGLISSMHSLQMYKCRPQMCTHRTAHRTHAR